MRTSLALILSAGLLVSLAACSSSSAASDCASATPSGDSSAAVTATGELGSDPKATFPFPLTNDSPERSLLVDGSGQPGTPGGVVVTTYTLYDAGSGEALSQTQPAVIPLTVTDSPNSLPKAFTDAFLCAPAGSRVAVVLPQDVAGTVFQGAPGGVVMVADVSTAVPGRATGADQLATPGFPGVVHGPDGRPGISIVSGDKPTESKAAVLKKGDGPVVAADDNIIVQATAVSYANPGKVANTTWEDGQPQLWTMSDKAQPSQTSWQPAGITPFLTGQTVGSEVIVILTDDSGSSATAYVVDILGILPSASK